MVLQWIASAFAGSHHLHLRGSLFVAIMTAIGTAYEWTHSDNLLKQFLGFVFGVGLCEEITKLIPLVMLILWRADRKMSVHEFLFIGFISGLGFGIGEAVYGYAPWSGVYGLDANIIRWFSAVPSHGLYSTICAAFLWKMADHLEQAESSWGRLGVVAMAAGTMAVVHGIYDTVCTLGIIPSLLVEAASFALLVWAVTWVSVDAKQPAGENAHAEPTVLLKPRWLGMGLGCSSLLLLGAAGLSSRSSEVMPAILRRELPEEVRPYIDGVTLPASQDGQTGRISAKFIFSLEEEAITGTFTNTTDTVLRQMEITCLNHGLNETKKFPMGDLPAHGTCRINTETGWSFAPHEVVTITNEGKELAQLTLP